MTPADFMVKVGLITSPKLTGHETALLAKVVDPVVSHHLFPAMPASRSGKHHFTGGGLMQHTLEVLQIAFATAAEAQYSGCVEEIDFFSLACAAVWHDFGKVDEYKLICRRPFGHPYEPEEVEKHPIYGETSHITRGLEAFGRLVPADLVPQETRAHIVHLIESHHGRKEWGSPRAPHTIEALILHQADMVSTMASGGTNPESRKK